MNNKPHRFILLLSFAALVLLASKTATAFPTGGGGCYFCSPYTFGGSTITFDLTSNDANDLAPITFNFIENPSNPGTGKLCLSGKIRATIVEGSAIGEATYDLLGADGTDRGVCYENVTQTCSSIPGATVGTCSADKCEYTVPELHNANINIAELLDGRFKVDTDLPMTGPYAACATDPTINVCDFEVGFGFDGTIPVDFFPATTALNNDPVDANVVLYANEVCIECSPEALGEISGTIALKSKSDTLRACEALVIKTDWCNDLQSSTGPNCIGDPNNPPIGGMNTAMGDFQNQSTSGAICISSLDDLKTLPSCDTEIALAACGDGPGYLTFPELYEVTSCVGSSGEIFYFSAAEGSGSATVNIAAIGANPDAPGYPGDNTIPQILASWTAIISTPDNQLNIWDFSEADLYRVAFIHARNNNDQITGSKGSDTIMGGSGADVLNGHDDNDVLLGGDNTDQLFGDNGNDLLIGYECNGANAKCSSFSNNGSDNDVLSGGNGNDCLDGGRGSDTLTGGAGSDAFVLFGDPDSDIITDYSIGEDVIVDLTGKATANWVKGSKKDDIASICEVTSGGNNAAIIEGITSMNDCNNLTILDITSGDTLPAQCEAHPYSFQ
ncbi:MAG: hypothetical protein KAT90_05390 [Gammaproteobacteria bacterium]|nr:hypothetical protein [Gammaproteobacteria bacterium]